MSHLKILWHSEDNSAGGSKRIKKESKKEEEMGRYQGMYSNGDSLMGTVFRNDIFGAPTTAKVKGLR